ncbi:PP2C family protein-serine/threonine phosphatase [Streptomyces termitum]|uniref:PP2C family protein-serine/threonine phosphatase n=1 Tax=Streptomyces termitum TaxID=67368 RepID=UPI0033B4EC21
MDQNPQPPSHGLDACPNPDCAEPVDPRDRYCGACGHDLSASADPPAGQDRPTVPIAAPVWPEAPPRDPGSLSTATQHPGDLPGTDSGGRDLTRGGAGEVPVRTDGPARPAGETARGDGDFELAAPDPRAAVRAEPAGSPEFSGPPEPPVAAVPSATGGAGEAGEAAGVAPAGTCVACRAGRVDEDGYCENCGHAQPRERDHMERALGTVAAVSDRGLRHHRNEDAFAVAETALPDGRPAAVAIVCDGVSSAHRPDEASAAAARAAGALVAEALPRGTHPQQAMHEAIVAAAEAVTALVRAPGPDGTVQDPPPGGNSPACTIVGSVVADDLLVVGWVGDSRAYWVPDDRRAPAARLTEDDSWAAQMVKAGLMSEEQAYADERAHAITGWLGADAYELEPHTAAFKPDRPGVVVVCTDGLWNYAEAADALARVLPADAALRPLHAAQVLVGHALDGGGHDNITVALLPFAPPAAGAASP